MFGGQVSAHEWVDWFERGDAHLSSRGYMVAREVAAYAARDPRNAEIRIVAHSDSIEARNDPDLDRRRAFAMMAELLQLGISPGQIRAE